MMQAARVSFLNLSDRYRHIAYFWGFDVACADVLEEYDATPGPSVILVIQNGEKTHEYFDLGQLFNALENEEF